MLPVILCRDCDFKAPIEEWEFVTEGRRKVLCVECSFRYCAREWCSFKAPLETWKIKTGGVPGKWCEKCCDVARTRELNKSDAVKKMTKIEIMLDIRMMGLVEIKGGTQPE